MIDVMSDMPDQRRHREEGPAAHGFASQNAEPDLDQVQPRSANGRKLKMDIG